MTETLNIRQIGEDLTWLLSADDGTVRLRGSGSLESFSERMAEISWSGQANVILGGEDVLLNRVPVPSRQTRQIQQAVPYLIEEQVATDVEDCHFAWGARDGGTLLVATCAAEAFEQTLNRYADLTIQL